MSYFGIFMLPFEKAVVIFEISTLRFAWFQVSQKMLKFETKNVWFRYFWIGIWKKYCHIWNHHSQICLIAYYCEIMKIHKFGTKSALTGYICKILKSYCHSWNQHLQISVIAKFCVKPKTPKFGTKNALLGVLLNKNALFGYIWARILKKL